MTIRDLALLPLEPLPEGFYTRFLSTLALNRKDDPLCTMLPLESSPNVLSLLFGKPNSSAFPITSLSFTLQTPHTSPSTSPESNPTSDIAITLTQKELDVALQYSFVAGIPDLLGWFYRLQEISHGRKGGVKEEEQVEGWRLSVGNGSQDLIYKAVAALVNPGDPVFLESPTYAGVIPLFQTIGCNIHEVPMDAEGICSHQLRVMLESWPASKLKPKILYTVPYGCNPSGVTASLPRRLELLALAHEHNFLILEDDPYYYIYYGPTPRPPSYFALERTHHANEVGRVIRFDSLSKILSAGLRIGFASGPVSIIKAIDRHSANANLQPNSMSQVLVNNILTRWGHAGFLAHTERVSQFYCVKRDVFEAALRRHLTGLVEWHTPQSGMFIWFRLLLQKSVDLDATSRDADDSEAVIRTYAFKRGVLALPGTVFLPSGRKTAYARAAFSTLEPELVDEALRRLRQAILDAREADTEVACD